MVMMSLLLTLMHVADKSSVSPVDFEHVFAFWYSNLGTISSICNAKRLLKMKENLSFSLNALLLNDS